MKYILLLILICLPLIYTAPAEYVIKKKDPHYNVCRAFVRQYDDVTNVNTACFEYDMKLYSLPIEMPEGSCQFDIHAGPGHLPSDVTIPNHKCNSNYAITNYANARWKTIMQPFYG